MCRWPKEGKQAWRRILPHVRSLNFNFYLDQLPDSYQQLPASCQPRSCWPLLNQLTSCQAVSRLNIRLRELDSAAVAAIVRGLPNLRHLALAVATAQDQQLRHSIL